MERIDCTSPIEFNSDRDDLKHVTLLQGNFFITDINRRTNLLHTRATVVLKSAFKDISNFCHRVCL